MAIIRSHSGVQSTNIKVRMTLYSIINSTTWKHDSVAFIWMVEHKGFIQTYRQYHMEVPLYSFYLNCHWQPWVSPTMNKRFLFSFPQIPPNTTISRGCLSWVVPRESLQPVKCNVQHGQSPSYARSHFYKKIFTPLNNQVHYNIIHLSVWIDSAELCFHLSYLPIRPQLFKNNRINRYPADKC